MKECTKCHLVKPLEEFPLRKDSKDGRNSQCNVCKRAIAKAYRATPEGAAAIKAAAQRYRESPHGKTARKADHASPEQVAQRVAYAKTERGKEAIRRHQKRYRAQLLNTKRGRLRVGARLAISHAIENGKLAPALACLCEHCGAPAVAYHHDLGYAKRYWLHVIPLCHPCHTLAHSSSAEPG